MAGRKRLKNIGRHFSDVFCYSGSMVAPETPAGKWTERKGVITCEDKQIAEITQAEAGSSLGDQAEAISNAILITHAPEIFELLYRCYFDHAIEGYEYRAEIQDLLNTMKEKWLYYTPKEYQKKVRAQYLSPKDSATVLTEEEYNLALDEYDNEDYRRAILEKEGLTLDDNGDVVEIPIEE